MPGRSSMIWTSADLERVRTVLGAVACTVAVRGPPESDADLPDRLAGYDGVEDELVTFLRVGDRPSSDPREGTSTESDASPSQITTWPLSTSTRLLRSVGRLGRLRRALRRRRNRRMDPGRSCSSALTPGVLRLSSGRSAAKP